MQNKRNVFIVDDHPFVMEGMAKLINEEADLNVCGVAGNPASAIKEIDKLLPDAVTIDITLGKKNGLDLIKELKYRYPSMPMLVLSMHDERVYAERCLKAGASGYVMKSEDPSALIAALRKILKGKVYLSEVMTDYMLMKAANQKKISAESPVESLSDREYQVFTYLGQGMKNKNIAEILNLSVKTVDTFKDNIKHKLNIATSNELMQFAISWVHSEENK